MLIWIERTDTVLQNYARYCELRKKYWPTEVTLNYRCCTEPKWNSKQLSLSWQQIWWSNWHDVKTRRGYTLVYIFYHGNIFGGVIDMMWIQGVWQALVYSFYHSYLLLQRPCFWNTFLQPKKINAFSINLCSHFDSD